MKPLEIKSGIYWVGIVDWDLRDFHGYATERGSTYNAYLIRDKKTCLFDTVKSEHTDEFLRNLSEVTDLRSIDYIVVNHAEMDHSGALPTVIEKIQPEKIFGTAKAMEALRAHFGDQGWPFEIVKEGDTIELGTKTIEFIGTPMLHWPESMASFVREDNVLISNDIFGQHWATSERFDDQVDQGELLWQSAKYFANIFLPTAGATRKLVSKLETKGIQPDMLLVDHGLIWRSNVKAIMDKYSFWGGQGYKPKAVIVYDTMWSSTARMARAIGRGLWQEDVSVKLLDLRFNHRSDVITEMLEARAVLLGSPVLNKNILPKMADMLSYMKSLKPGNKLGAAFGSYGWQDSSVKQLNEAMTELKFEVIHDGVSCQYVPAEDDISRCEELGAHVCNAILG